jgi:lysozyme
MCLDALTLLRFDGRVTSSRTWRSAFAIAAFAFATAALAACETDRPACIDSTSQSLRTCAGANTVSGIDVSSWQGTVDFTQVAGAGAGFVFLRLSSGQNVDTRFAANWPAAKNAGLVRGAYQYFWPARDVDEQVDVLVRTLRDSGFSTDDLPPVLDLETLDGLAPATVATFAQHWLARVEAELHVRPLVYTANFMSNVTGYTFSAYPLWVANYGATCPLMPTGWTSWVFWQSSESGRIAGVAGNVDLDTFNGSTADLLAFARSSHIPSSDAGADATAEGGMSEGGADADPRDGAVSEPARDGAVLEPVRDAAVPSKRRPPIPARPELVPYYLSPHPCP